jgi:hypothetical protein
MRWTTWRTLNPVLSLRHYPISGISLLYQLAHIAARHQTLFWLHDMRGYYASPSAGRDVGCDKLMRRIAEGDMIYPALRSLVAGLFVYLQSIICSVAQQPFSAPAPIMPPSLPPSHVADLMTSDGSAAFGAIWRVMEAKPVEVPASPEAKPQYKTTHQISPRAGAKGFDDSSWPIVAPTDLGARIGGGHMSFMWYRATLTIPPKIGNFDTTDTQAVLRVLVDDYAEIWINGDIPRRSGYPSPATIQG